VTEAWDVAMADAESVICSKEGEVARVQWLPEFANPVGRQDRIRAALATKWAADGMTWEQLER